MSKKTSMVRKIFSCFKMELYEFFTIAIKGQQNCYAILQISHRLEKGLSVCKPRKLWGWNKAEELVERLQQEIKNKNGDKFSISVGQMF